MIKIFLLPIVIMFPFSSISQELLIKELNISEVKTIRNSDESYHGQGDGPYARFNFEILNSLERDLRLNIPSATLAIRFNYEGHSYEESIMSYFMDENEEVILLPNSSRIFSAGTPLFIGTDLLKEGKSDYSLELIKVLPTIQLIYSDNSGLEMVSKGVDIVSVSNYVAGDEN